MPGENKKIFHVFEENAPAVEMFVRCDTQWRTSFNGITGLDYAAVKAVLEIFEVEDKKRLMDDIRIMEVAALTEINKEKA